MVVCVRTRSSEERGTAPFPLIHYNSTLEARSSNCAPLGETIYGALGRVGFGALVLNERGDVISISAEGRRLLEQKMGCHAAVSETEWLRQATRRLFARTTPWLPDQVEAWVIIPCESDRPLALYRVASSDGDGRSGNVIFLIVDLEVVPQPNPETLRRIFGLTPAEARLAAKIGRGETLNKIARENGVCIATLRSQLAAIFGKTRTCRQTELAMLLARIAILP